MGQLSEAEWKQIFKEIEDLDTSLYIESRNCTTYKDWVSLNENKYSEQDKQMLDYFINNDETFSQMLSQKLSETFKPEFSDEKLKKKIGYSFFYREYCRNYKALYSNYSSDVFHDFIIKSWDIKDDKNSKDNYRDILHSTYYENAQVWLNELIFSKQHPFPAFAEMHYYHEDTWDTLWKRNNKNSNNNYEYYNEVFINEHLPWWNFKQIITTASNLEHLVVSDFIEGLANKIGEKVKRFELSGLCRCEVVSVRKNFHILHIATNEMGSFTNCGTKSTLDKLFTSDRCTDCVAAIGICYGIMAKDYTLGDVMVSSEIISHYTYKRKEEKVELLDNSVLGTYGDLDKRWQAGFDADKYYYGPMFSGGAVLSNATEKNRMIDAYKDKYGVKDDNLLPIAGEMEGDGIYRACKRPVKIPNSHNQEYPCIVIKAICDWGAMKNCWNLIAADQEKKEKDSKPDAKIYTGEKYQDTYGNSAPINDIMKNSVQAYGVKKALVIWGNYFTFTYKEPLKTKIHDIEDYITDYKKRNNLSF